MSLDFSEFLEAYEKFKSAYADLVAYIQDKPLDILVEIENAFSHLTVTLNEPQTEIGKKNLDKAISHLHRATLDCYKLLWVKLGQDVELILKDKKKRMASSLEAKEFWKLWEDFKNKSQKARRLEMENIGRNPLAAIEAYQKACYVAWEIAKSVDDAKYVELKRFYFRSKVWELLASALAGAFLTKFLEWLFHLFKH